MRLEELYRAESREPLPEVAGKKIKFSRCLKIILFLQSEFLNPSFFFSRVFVSERYTTALIRPRAYRLTLNFKKRSYILIKLC